jgi:toxin ParE1/3/4
LRVVFRDRAVADLREITDYSIEHFPASTATLLDDIEDAIARVADMPGIGSPRPELYGLRSWNVGSYFVLYRVEADVVEIVRVAHGSRSRDLLELD